MQQRLYIAELLSSDESFHNLSYWDYCCTYYCDQESKLYAETVIPTGEDWAFVSLEPREEELLIPKEDLEAHQLVIAKNGYANFKALNKYTNEVYMTETISIKDLFKTF